MCIPFFAYGTEAEDYIEFQGTKYNASSVATMFKEYFGEPTLQYQNSMDYQNISVLVFDTSFFVVSKHEWLSPIISVTEEGDLDPELFKLIDDAIQDKINTDQLPSLEEQNRNKRKWVFLFEKWGYLFESDDASKRNPRRASHYNTSNTQIEKGYKSIKLYNIHQREKKGSSIKVNHYAPIVDGQKTPVGCGPLAIARIMNWHEHPKTDAFGYGNTYSSLDASKMTYSFARLVRDIGRYGGATYKPKSTSLTDSQTTKIFEKAGYSITKLADLDDSRYSASQLYIKMKSEVDAGRLAYLSMWYDCWDSKKNEWKTCGHGMVVNGYKKIDPKGYALEDLYMHAAFGQSKKGGGYYDLNWIQLDAYGGWLDTVLGVSFPGFGSVEQSNKYGTTKKMVRYVLYGNIAKKPVAVPPTNTANSHIDKCIRTFANYFGRKSGSPYSCYTNYVCQNTTGGSSGSVTKIAIHKDLAKDSWHYYWGKWNGPHSLSYCK